MCNPVEVKIGAFNQRDMAKYDSEPAIYGKLMIPLRLVQAGHQDQMTRGQLAEQIILALEAGLADYRQYINKLRVDVSLESTDLPFEYQQHKVNQ